MLRQQSERAVENLLIPHLPPGHIMHRIKLTEEAEN